MNIKDVLTVMHSRLSQFAIILRGLGQCHQLLSAQPKCKCLIEVLYEIVKFCIENIHVHNFIWFPGSPDSNLLDYVSLLQYGCWLVSLLMVMSTLIGSLFTLHILHHANFFLLLKTRWGVADNMQIALLLLFEIF